MWIETEADLAARYGEVGAASRDKERPALTPAYRAVIEASPFCVLATVGPEGLDASPRGDGPGFVRVVDERTLVMPDRRGNNRLDSLRNVVRDGRVALLFMVPGLNETLRVNGRARLSVDPVLLAAHAHAGKTPSTALVIEIETVYFQCARALVRSDLWNPEARRPRADLPSAGTMLAQASEGFDGAGYDAALPARQAATLY